MKLFEMHACVNQRGRIILPAEWLGAAGLKPGDEVCVTMALREETDNMCRLALITPKGVEVTVQLSDQQEGDEVTDLTLTNELLEAAGIPENSNLDIICADGAIVIMEADILDNLPGDLRQLFDMLGMDPDTVREVMRKEGYFV